MTTINVLKQVKRKPRAAASVYLLVCWGGGTGPDEWTGNRGPQREAWTAGSPCQSLPLLLIDRHTLLSLVQFCHWCFRSVMAEIEGLKRNIPGYRFQKGKQNQTKNIFDAPI